MADNDNLIQASGDKLIIDYFTGLKGQYKSQRQSYESKWRIARQDYYSTEDQEKIFNSRSNIKPQIIDVKVNGVVSRINRTIFKNYPFGRIETKKEGKKMGDKSKVDLWNAYIFDDQMHTIQFQKNYKMFNKDQMILGTGCAKITQESKDVEIDYFDDDKESISMSVKDNTYFRPLLLEEFYSDVSKPDINDSSACIHSTSVRMEDLLSNKKKTIKSTREVIKEVQDPVTGSIVEVKVEEEFSEEVGIYDNLNLIMPSGSGLSPEQQEYLQLLGLNSDGQKVFQKSLEGTKKTGFVNIDECWGMYDLDGDGIPEEVVCVIANGLVVVRIEATPFKHRKYVRPFIVSPYIAIPGCLYGESKVVKGHSLLMEYNASRAQASEAKTRSIFHMWYLDSNKQIAWDYKWRNGGIVKGQGSNGIQPLISPDLSSIKIEDSLILQKDFDQLYNQSPIQEGTTDTRLIPGTATGTVEVIRQNDIPLNDIIESKIENEIKVFLEMLFERNLTFKTPADLLSVWSEEDILKAGLGTVESMRDLFFEPNIKISGSLEITNEQSHQRGYERFLANAQQIPPWAKRVDWRKLGDKMLRTYGIKDDSIDIWMDEELVQKAQQEGAQAQQQQAQSQQQLQQQQLAQDEALNTKKAVQEFELHKAKKEVDTQQSIKEKTAEVVLESRSGQKVM